MSIPEPVQIRQSGQTVKGCYTKGLSITKAVKFAFATSNNEAEYEMLLLGLWLAKELSIAHLELQCDS